MIITISILILAFVTGFILRGYIIDNNHNQTLLNHKSDISIFLKETKQFRDKIYTLQRRNKILENRVFNLIHKAKKMAGKETLKEKKKLHRNKFDNSYFTTN